MKVGGSESGLCWIALFFNLDREIDVAVFVSRKSVGLTVDRSTRCFRASIEPQALPTLPRIRQRAAARNLSTFTDYSSVWFQCGNFW